MIQLALNIASPEVYISIKACLDDGRKLHHSTGVLNTDLACEEIGMSQPPTSEAFAAIERRLRDWKAYSMAKHNRVSGNHIRSPSSRASVRNLRSNKGNYWDHLVQLVRGGILNILCLIPQRVTIMPPSEGTALTATSYRDLMVGDCILVGKIFKVFRPTLVASADARLIWTLSSLRGPSYQYGLERSNEGIIIHPNSHRAYCCVPCRGSIDTFTAASCGHIRTSNSSFVFFSQFPLVLWRLKLGPGVKLGCRSSGIIRPCRGLLYLSTLL